MEKNKYLKYCKYYKGEDTIPENMNNNQFWYLERGYVTSYDNNHQDWEHLNMLSMCIEKFPETKEFINSFEDEFVREMLATFVILSYSHTPQSGVDFIFDYGK